VLTVSANPTQIGINGSSMITISGFRPDGNPLNPGTQIQLTTDLGVLSSTLLSVDSAGSAVAILNATGQSGPAIVSAKTVGGGEEVMVTINIGEDDSTRPRLLITASPTIVGFGEVATVSVVARNADDSPFGSGGRVQLRTSLGRLRRPGTTGPGTAELFADTGGDSTAVADFVAGNEDGTASITATLGASAEVSADITIENQRPNLLISVENDIIPVRGSTNVTVIARDNNDVPLGSGLRVRLTSTLGSLNQTEPLTDQNGEVEVTFTAFDRAGTGEVRAILGSSAEVSTQITIRDAPATLDFQANPGTVNAGEDAMITLIATVLNAQGDPVAAASVTFGTDPNSGIGGSFASGSNLSTTDTQGTATDVLTIPQNELEGVTSFIVTAVVRGEGAEITRQRVINVNQ
jgi:hypothetical protein